MHLLWKTRPDSGLCGDHFGMVEVVVIIQADNISHLLTNPDLSKFIGRLVLLELCRTTELKVVYFTIRLLSGTVRLVVRYTPKVLDEMEARFDKQKTRRRVNWPEGRNFDSWKPDNTEQ